MSRLSFETPVRKDGGGHGQQGHYKDYRCPTPGDSRYSVEDTPIRVGQVENTITVRPPRSQPGTLSEEWRVSQQSAERVYISLPLPWFPYKFTIKTDSRVSQYLLLYLALPFCTLMCMPPLNYIFGFLHTFTMRVLISFKATCFFVSCLFLLNIGYFLGPHILAFTLISLCLPLLFVLHVHTRIQYYGLLSFIPSSIVRGLTPFFDRSLLDLTHLEWEGSSCMDVLALLLFNVEPEHRKHVLDRLPEGAQRLQSTKPYNLLPEVVRSCLLPTCFGITPTQNVDIERFEAVAKLYEEQRDNISLKNIMNEVQVQSTISLANAKSVWIAPIQSHSQNTLHEDTLDKHNTPIIGGRPMFVTPFRSHVHQILSAPCVPGPTFDPTTPLPFALASYGAAHLKRSVQNMISLRFPIVLHALKRSISSQLGDATSSDMLTTSEMDEEVVTTLGKYAKVGIITSTMLTTVRLLTSKSSRNKVMCLVQTTGWATYTIATFLIIARAINVRVMRAQHNQQPSATHHSRMKRLLWWATKGNGVEFVAVLAVTLWGILQSRRPVPM